MSNKPKLAINGGKPIRDKPFDMSPIVGKEEIGAVIDVIKNKKFSTFHSNFLGGEKVREFENNFAKYNKCSHVISVNSGTAALHVALAALGIGPGDEVIVPAYTFTATASSVLMNNSIPVFADVNLNTFNIDSQDIERKITDKTKAIIPVHLLGNPADMKEIMEIAEKHNLKVIEDSAQAIGSKYKGKYTGTIGDCGTFSFQETKNMMTGEGGMILTKDSKIAEKCQLIRNHGEASVVLKNKPRSYITNILGWNYRMTELEAAIGVEQLKKLNNLNDVRVKNSKFLSKHLSELKGIMPQKIDSRNTFITHIHGMVFDKGEVGTDRKKFVDAIIAEGIPLSLGYPHPLYKNPLFINKIVYGSQGCPFNCKFYEKKIDYKKVSCPNTELLCNEKAIWITQIKAPSTLKDMEDIVSAFKKVYYNINELK